MRSLNFGLFFIIISSFYLTCISEIKSVSFLSNSNIYTTDIPQRDGIVLVTLSTNEVTTICNYKFNEINANIVCKTLGFPAKGITIVNNAKSNVTGEVLLANFNCTGSEQSLAFCVNSGRSVQPPPCSDHTMDVHVYCLQAKEAPIVILNTTTVCNLTSLNYSFINKGSLQNTGFLQVNLNGKAYSVCNDDYSFTNDAIMFVCKQLCLFPNNPTIVMPYPNATSNLTSVKLSCQSSNSCTASLSTDCFKSSYLVGLKCGDEPQNLEKAPTIKCTDQNMTLIWPSGFTPYINSSMVNLKPTCDSVIKNDSSSETSMLIPFNNCTAVISGDANNVIFIYTVTREYIFNNNVQQLPRTVTFSCFFPRTYNPTESFKFNEVTKFPMNASQNLGIGMNFYSDSGLTTEVFANGQINSDILLYVKVYIINPPKNVSLILKECSVSTVNQISDLNVSNSVFLIKDNCPNSIYDVIISPLSRTEIKFQFSPFKTLSTPSILLYVHCKTNFCYLNQDKDCPFCGNRKKRSVNPYLESYEVGRSLFLVEK